MQNINMKVLKIMAICIVVLLSFILIIISTKNAESPVEKVVYYESINNNERIAHYGDQLYCCSQMFVDGKKKNVLLKMPIDFNDSSSREIVDVFDTFSVKNKTLHFYGDKVFYKNGNTYMYDMAKKSIDVFCEGDLQFMLEPDGFVMLENGDIYKGTYYPATYMARRFEKIADGNFIKRGEDDKKVYYSSLAGSNTIVISLDKESLKIVTLDNIDTSKRSVKDVWVTDDYIYEMIDSSSNKYIRKISKELNENGEPTVEEIEIGKYDLVEIIDFKYTRPLNINEKLETNQTSNDFYFYGSVITKYGDQYGTSTEYDKKMYKYDEAQNTVTVYDGKLNERFFEDYSGDINGSIIELYHGEEQITELETNLTELVNIEVIDVNIVQDKEIYYLYYEIEALSADGTVENIFARTFANGGESQRINIPQS